MLIAGDVRRLSAAVNGTPSSTLAHSPSQKYARGMGDGSRPAMRRARADQIIEKLVFEAGAINADAKMSWRVAIISVFGSYLTDKAVLGDLDIGVRLERREGMRAEADAERFSELYPPPTYIRRDWFSRLCWPETYVRRRLKLARGISLHEQDEVETHGFPHRVIYDAAER